MNTNTNQQTRYQHIELTFTALKQECSRCASDLHPDWQTCAHCDARLATECPSCGLPLPPAGATHCGHCGLTFRPSTTT